LDGTREDGTGLAQSSAWYFDARLVMSHDSCSASKDTACERCEERCTVLLGYLRRLWSRTGDVRSEEGRKLVDEYHTKYIAALKELWEANKDKYAPKRIQELEIVQ